MTGKTGSISALSPVIPAPQKIRQYSAYNLLNKGLYSIGYLYDFSGIPLYSEKALPSPCLLPKKFVVITPNPLPQKMAWTTLYTKRFVQRIKRKILCHFWGSGYNKCPHLPGGIEEMGHIVMKLFVVRGSRKTGQTIFE